MKRITSIILLLVLLISISACGAADINGTAPSDAENTQQTEPSNEETTEATEPSTEARLVTYPLNVGQAYSDYAVSLPEHIYTTTGTENGLAGTIYVFEGTVEMIMVSPDETNTFTYEDAFVNTAHGTVIITNLYKTVYNSTVAAYGEAAAKANYSDNVEDYIFPEEGTVAQFIVVYMGYSLADEMPVFILGASPVIFEISEYNDPVASDSQSTDPTAPPTSSSEETEPPATEEETEPPATEKETEPTETEPPAAEKETEPEKPSSGATAGEKNALSSAADYLRVMPFSYGGLIEQLLYEGYTNEEATYAANNCGADWNAQALRAAQNYLNTMPFSYSGLISQLQYEQYTTSQATYGADNCGADWNAQAARAAANYLSIMSFSRDELIAQLQYEGYTYDQAVYGADANGL